MATAHLIIGTLASSGGIYIRAFEWSDDGLGIAITAPTADQTGTVYDIDYSSVLSKVLLTNLTNPKLYAYPWSEDTGFGVKHGSAPGITASVPVSAKFTPQGDAVLYGNAFSPYIHAWKFSSSGFGTKYSNPSVLPSGTPTNRLTITPGGDAVCFGMNSVNGPCAYPWNYTTGFGVKYSNPVGFPSESIRNAEFSPDGNHIIFSLVTSNAYKIYEWDSSTGFGVEETSPAITGSGGIDGIEFNPKGTALFIVSAPSPYVHAYAWSDGLGIKYSNPASTASSSPYVAAVSPSGKHVLAIGSSAQYAYDWNDSTGFGIRTGISITSGSNTVYAAEFTGSLGTIFDSFKANIYEEWKDVENIKVNIYEEWKDIAAIKVNIYEEWKDLA